MSAYDEVARMRTERAKKYKRNFLSSSAGFLTKAAEKIVGPHKNSLRNLRDIPLTATGTGLVDFAAFHLAHGWGWLVTGVSLMVLEHVIADRED